MMRADRLDCLYRDIKRMMDRGEVPHVTFDLINSTFGNALHHHPMYFPLPGMPSPGNALEDFKQWLEVQGWEAVEDLQKPILAITRRKTMRFYLPQPNPWNID